MPLLARAVVSLRQRPPALRHLDNPGERGEHLLDLVGRIGQPPQHEPCSTTDGIEAGLGCVTSLDVGAEPIDQAGEIGGGLALDPRYLATTRRARGEGLLIIYSPSGVVEGIVGAGRAMRTNCHRERDHR